MISNSLDIWQSVMGFNEVLAEYDFVSVWNTENLGGTGSATLTILLPMDAGPTVDWGDGTINNLNTHLYAAGGVKIISISDEASFRFNNGGDKLKITNVTQSKLLVIGDTGAFFGCSNLTWTATDSPKITTTDLSLMFSGATVFNGNLDGWPTHNVTDMGSCFSNNKALDHIMDWPVESCLNFSFMYSEANDVIYSGMVYELKPDASIDCSNMFRANNEMPDPMGFTNSDSITNHGGMYSFTDVDDFPSAYDFTNSTNMASMFQQADLQGTITALNVPLVVSLSDTFGNNNLTSVTGVITSTALLNTSFMLSSNLLLTNVGLFDTQNVTTAQSMFHNCFALTNLPAFDWSSCSNFTNFLLNVTIDTTDYDALLVEIDANGLSSGTLNGGSSTYTSAGAGGTARTSLVGKSWTIVDGGGV